MTRYSMTEKELQQNVIDLAHLLKWKVAHFRPALTQSGHWRTPVAADGKGFPDLVLVRDRVMFVEMKSHSGSLSEEQVDWNGALVTGAAEAYIWRPADWESGLIEEVLRRGASRPTEPCSRKLTADEAESVGSVCVGSPNDSRPTAEQGERQTLKASSPARTVTPGASERASESHNTEPTERFQPKEPA